MKTKLFPLRTGSALSALSWCVLLGAAASGPLHARPASVSYAPGITLAPEVLQPDGATPRTYATATGTTLWMPGLPIAQGDKIKLNLFAATGGAELKEIRVRLDNTPLPGMPLTAAPWKTVLDTSRLALGYHLVEVWAEATGDKPQSTTKTLTFYVSRPSDARVLVKPSLQQLQGGTATALPSGGAETVSDTPPAAPSFLQGKLVDGSAQVVVTARPVSAAASAPGTAALGNTVTLGEPTLFIVQAAPGSTAVRFAYALVRGTDTTASSTGYGVNSFRLRLQKKDSDTGVGLNAGTLALWVWGIDAEGRPSDPVKTTLVVPE